MPNTPLAWKTCRWHGRRAVRPGTRDCWECYLETIIPGMFLRETAKTLGEKIYPGDCYLKHRSSFRWVSTGECAACTHEDGTFKIPTDFKDAPPVRVLANNNREPSFFYHCDVHGPAYHHTRTGLCSRCFGGNGRPRALT